ncbi:DUF6364 family protein [Bacteroides gallinaceum]|uniref:Toxin-antitoxin system protein n=1 Tax=Phocaeicola intestinalis TaxID=2762212 RepID=A0ABR8Y6B7_9BACT|nr:MULTISPECIES: DUF6364 family protein [Bacteroidaceae]MBD8039735.1 hypothetical protein [Phocaeicola intestinalis]MBM6657319.1 hypothetical protein [Bacteroides gallinaceum]MDN0080114.1 DUF6364 family protein [Bacteroides gallinaceum]OUN81482.1 hypothetical protein B5G04_04165 [Bacteroides sp. An51A]
MNQNVTLSINSNVLQQASDYARSKGTDLSELVENLLKQVTGSKQKEKIRPVSELDPRVQRLVGVVRLDEKEVGLDGEISRTEHLERE